jgi:acyl carrier protein phosphodiesterase
MNLLAHIYLSGNNDAFSIGNFIADFIRGNNYKHLPNDIQKGILLHRQIDSFTDKHPIVRKSKRRLHERYGHYDGVIIDILYDHFLAKNWFDYSKIPLKTYESNFISLLESYFEILPEKVQYILPYLKQQKWLSGYATLEGIEKSLIGVNKRTKNKAQMHLAIEDLKLYYTDFETDFNNFFKDLRIFSNEIITQLTKQ